MLLMLTSPFSQRKVRGTTLIDMHSESTGSTSVSSHEANVIWDHARDMSLGGRLMDDHQRNKILKDARGLRETVELVEGGY